jgi:hypothetical protein
LLIDPFIDYINCLTPLSLLPTLPACLLTKHCTSIFYALTLAFPLTSLVFTFSTPLAAQFILHEKGTTVNWAGVLLITIGATPVG